MSLKYAALADALKEEISRRGPGGDRKLPTELQLSQMYGVSRQTVRQALLILQKEGLIEKRQGSGSYISSSAFPRAGVPNSIAILVPSTVSHPASRQIWGAQSYFDTMGYSAQLYLTENLASREREILQALADRPVSGILSEGVRTAFPNPNTACYKTLLEMGTRLVFVGEGYPEMKSLPRISFDEFGGGELLTRHLLSLGHKKIAGIFRLDNQADHLRYAGVLHTLGDSGIAFDDRDFLWYGPSDSQTPDAKQLLSFIRIQLADSTAVICPNHATASMLIRELQRLQIPVPGHISVVAFGPPAANVQYPVRVTCAQSPGSDPWISAAQTLLQSIRQDTLTPAADVQGTSVMFRYRLQQLDSDGPPPAL